MSFRYWSNAEDDGVRKNASDLLVQSRLMHAPALKFGRSKDARKKRQLAKMTAQQRSEYRKCQDLSQAKLRFPHHKTLYAIAFGILSTRVDWMLKTFLVEKVSKSLFYSVLRRGMNGENFGKLLQGIGLRMWKKKLENCRILHTSQYVHRSLLRTPAQSGR